MSRRSWLVVGFVLLDVLIIALAWWFIRVRQPDYDNAGADGAAVTGALSGLEDNLPDEDEVVGPLVLDVADDGTALRATIGNCYREVPVRVWTGDLDDGDPTPVEAPEGMAQIRHAFVDEGTFTLIGYDHDCAPLRATSDDGGAWDVGSLEGEIPWYYQHAPDPLQLAKKAWEAMAAAEGEAATATAAPLPESPTGGTGTDGSAPEDQGVDPSQFCQPSAVMDTQGGVVIRCTDERWLLAVADAFPRQLPTVPRMSGIVVEPEEFTVAAGIDVNCRARLDYTPADPDTAPTMVCVDQDRAATALTTWGDRFVMQVGNDILVTDDPASEDWAPISER